jgi:diphosphate-dependent phosphofructokinase
MGRFTIVDSSCFGALKIPSFRPRVVYFYNLERPSFMITDMDALQKARQEYRPVLPYLLRDLCDVGFTSIKGQMQEDQRIKVLFPLTSGQPFLKAVSGMKRTSKSLQIGVVFSGGQAAGGHNVVTGIYDCIQGLHSDSRLFGFLNGPAGIMEGKYKEFSFQTLAPYRNQGGFDMMGSGRTKIETEEQLRACLDVVQKMRLDGLVVIGGDDSNTSAAFLAEYFKRQGSAVKVVGVPKTIDGDLKNAHVATSFGFDTACKVYSEIIGNIARDAVSARKYYHFVKLMGRSASHITLECALVTHPNLALIGEEVNAKNKSLMQVVHEIADLVCKRAAKGMNFGIILIPEGLIEFIPEIGILIKELNQLLANEPLLTASSALEKLESSSQACFLSLPKKIQTQLLLSRDPHGNVHVSLIETERLLMDLVAQEVELRVKKGESKAKFFPLQHFLGYEGRSAYPSNFDCNYCYALGFAATLLIDEGVTGYMACISNLTLPPVKWGVGGVPLPALMHTEMRQGKEKPVVRKTLVDLFGKPFEHFQRLREQWKLQDDYRYLGPIQFEGAAALTERVALTLMLEGSSDTTPQKFEDWYE